MKTLKTSLIKYIVKTDFFILENKKIKNCRTVNLTSNKNFNILDVVELNFSLKQFIRILQFAKKANFLINIFILSKQFLKILENFFIKYEATLKNSIVLNENLQKSFKKTRYLELDLLLNIKQILHNRFFVFYVNSTFNRFDTGGYKIFNSLNSYKKFVVFLSIFHNVLKKNKHEIAKKI